MTRDQDDAAQLPERALGSADTWAEPEPALRDGVLAALRKQGFGGPVAVPGRPVPPVVDLGARRTARGRRLLVAAAAALVLVVGAGALVQAQREPAPDAVAALTASALAPGASGRAEFRDRDSGVEVVLDTEGLPPAVPGTYYQAWLKDAAGALVTIGTFHARGGGKDVVLWSAVDVQAYPTITVTLQQEGAGPASSRRVVLSGTVGR